jgi:hypothetical protein
MPEDMSGELIAEPDMLSYCKKNMYRPKDPKRHGWNEPDLLDMTVKTPRS